MDNFHSPHRIPEMNSSTSLSILVVDDEPDMLEIISEVLLDQHKVTTAANGAEAWKKISRSPREFDLVITDVNMPILDGVALLKRIKHDLPNIGVIMVSGVADAETAAQSIRKGAYNYLSKPFQRLEAIEEMVEAWIIEEKVTPGDSISH